MSRPPRPGIAALSALILVLALKGFVLDLAVVSGRSMLPTLAPGRPVLVLRAAYGLRLPPRLAPRAGYALRWASPRAGDIVEVASPLHGAALVKRVALVGPGTLETREGELYVPADSCFLVGDNPAESLDSRDYGPVSLEAVAGRVLARRGPTP